MLETAKSHSFQQLNDGATHASEALLRALERNDPGTIHRIEVPRLLQNGRVGKALEEAHEFPRATIVDALVDASIIMGVETSSRTLADECARFCDARRKDVRGGWSYLRNVPEMPPDLDDLGTIARAILRTKLDHLAFHCEDAIHFALQSFDEYGRRNTWIVDPDSRCSGAMCRYLQLIAKSDGCHPEVLANFLTTIRLLPWDDDTSQLLEKTATYIAGRQEPDGSWRTSFYGSRYYSTMMVMTALRSFPAASESLRSGISYLAQGQGPDGSWNSGDPLCSAWATLGLHAAGGPAEAIRSGISFLLNSQQTDGLWSASTFVRVSTPSGVHEQRSREITAAFCLKAIAVGPALFE